MPPNPAAPLDLRLKFRQFPPARQGAAVDRQLTGDQGVGESILGYQQCSALLHAAFG
jgi:hypothetical protein